MKKLFLTIVLLAGLTASAQVGIGTTSPNANSILDLTATNKALVLPRVANTAAIASPVNGMMIYDLSSSSFKAYQNGAWIDLNSVFSIDSIQSSLTTSLAAYTAAPTDTWVAVTAAEYNAVLAGVTNASLSGNIEADMSTAYSASPSDFSISSAPTIPTYGTNLSGSKYVIAISFVPYNNTTANNGFKLKIGPSATPTTGYIDYPNNTTFTNPNATYTTGTRVYYVMKKPTVLIAAGSYVLGAYIQSGLALGFRNGHGNRYHLNSGDVSFGSQGSDGQPYLIQAISTPTKAW